ncbi:MAG TPA: hypothetical protein VMV59_12100, partial [Candidatus Dormibacteraeota bacterium]|nr:hypothetical protein [Candidatus Dormibacteraeota bacterium]
NAERRADAIDLKTHQVSKIFADTVGFGAKVDAEKRFDRDAASETRHFIGDVADFAFPPLRCVRQRVLDHCWGVFVDARLLKRGLRETTLTPPEISFAIEQAVAEQTAGGDFRERAFVKFMLLDDENLFDQVGMIDEQAGLPESEWKINEVAIIARATGEKIEAVLAKFKSDADERLSARTWWTI